MRARKMVVVWEIAAACCLGLSSMAGCKYNREDLNAFLLRPRSPVSAGYTEYRLLPPDTFSISSTHVPEINGSYRIGPDGKVNFPLLGRIYIADLTTKELEQKLMDAAKQYYEQVDATVTVTGYNSQKYYVFGMGGGGGRQWTGRDTLLDALAGQASFQSNAWQEHVIVYRVPEPFSGGYIYPKKSRKYELWGINPTRPDRYKMEINLKAMWQHGDMANNILLKPNDIVYVRPHPFAWIGIVVRHFMSPVSPVLEAVRAPARIERGFERAGGSYNED